MTEKVDGRKDKKYFPNHLCQPGTLVKSMACVSRKVREFSGPEKPFVKMQPFYKAIIVTCPLGRHCLAKSIVSC